MTSNTEPEGVVTSDGVYIVGTTDAYKAFDKNNDTVWATAAGSSSGWIQYDFVNKFMCKLFTVKGTNYGLKDYTILASNDNFISESVVLYQGQTIQTQSYEIKDSVYNKTFFRYYRLYATPYKDEPGVNELNFYGRSQK